MFLTRIHLDPRSREARRDLADAYQLHATLSRAFSAPETRCPPGEFLWRLESESSPEGCPRVLVQSRSLPDWSRLDNARWLAGEPDPAMDLWVRLGLGSLRPGQKYRFRLRANPSITRNGKRTGLLQLKDQEAWLRRQGLEHHGFLLPDQPSDILP